MHSIVHFIVLGGLSQADDLSYTCRNERADVIYLYSWRWIVRADCTLEYCVLGGFSLTVTADCL